MMNPNESPTGMPVIPPSFIRVAVPVTTAAAGIATAIVALAPPHTVAWHIASGLLGVLAWLGVMSPGWRKP